MNAETAGIGIEQVLHLRMDGLVRRIGAQSVQLPTFDRTADAGAPHLEINGDRFDYVVVERGLELRRRTTLDLDELLYWIFSDVTFSLASRFAVGADRYREVMFHHQLDLLAQLDKRWRDRKKIEIDGILACAPLADGR